MLQRVNDAFRFLVQAPRGQATENPVNRGSGSCPLQTESDHPYHEEKNQYRKQASACLLIRNLAQQPFERRGDDSNSADRMWQPMRISCQDIQQSAGCEFEWSCIDHWISS